MTHVPGRCASASLWTAIALSLVTPAFAQQPVKRVGVWAQSYTGRQADPAIRFGQLPNGLRYAILKNATPPGQMSLRLYIGSGSLAESDQQQGLAHFLEHMAFRGSTHLADGELAKVLARYGLSFGADTNAATSQDATVYQFDFPKAGSNDVETGLGLFREIASNLTLSKASIDAERGVILSEERLRDTPAFRQAKAEVDFLLPGQLAAKRWPIGRVEIIQNATPDELRQFYKDNYRPDNAVIVAVGDFDPAVVEAQIRQKFSDWAPAGKSARPATGMVQKRGEEVGLFVEPGAPQNVQTSWVRPYDDGADTDAHEERDDMRAIAALIFNHRLQDIAQRPDAPFVAAQFGRADLLKSADLTNLAIIAPADKWQVAMQAAIDEQQRMVRFGVTQPEIDRVLTEFKSFFTSAAAGASTRQTPKLADAIVKNVNDAEVTRSPEQDLAEIAGVSAKATIATVNDAFKALFAGSGPLLFVSAPQAPTGGEQAIKSAFDAALQDKVTSNAAAANVAWPYQDFGAPGRVVERKEISDLGLTLVRFENGTTLTVKPTAFTKDEVLAAVGFGDGRLGLPSDLAHAYWLVNGIVPAFISSGTGKLSITDVQRILAARNSKLDLSLQDKSFQLAGQTQPANLEFELQLATAYLIDPGFRPEAVERFKAGVTSLLPQVDASATSVLQREQGIALHGGDRRWTILPFASDVAATKATDLKALLQPELRREPPSVVIVGDITVDQAIATVGKTLGALPLVATTKESLGAPVAFPSLSKPPLQFTHKGRPDQAFVLAAWPTSDFFSSPSDARTMTVISEIIRQRLIEQLRAVDGATYSPQTVADISQSVTGYGYLAAGVELPPAKIPLFQQRLTAIVADLRDKPVSADELDRAKTPLLQTRLRDQQQNIFWFSALIEARRDPRSFDAIRTRASGIQAVTADEVRSVSRKYLQRDFEIVVSSDTRASPQ